MRRLLPVVFALVPLTAFAADGLPRIARDRTPVARHYILTTAHTLRTDERAELAAEGVEIQQVLPEHRYVVRATNADAVADDPRVASIEPIALSRKVDRSAYREAALARPFAR